MNEKVCFKCNTSKPLDHFYRHPSMKDGHLNKCKSCTRKDVRQYRASNIDRVRKYDRDRANLPHRVALITKMLEGYKERHPDRRYAHSAVANALRDGRLEKLPCWVCGETMVEAHHPDYSSPLDVIWLCIPHHRQTHGMLRMIDED